LPAIDRIRNWEGIKAVVHDDPETEDLLCPAAAGDEMALGRLLDRHRERLRRMIEVRLDRRLTARMDASDVVQEALADAGRKLPSYAQERPLPFYPWLRRLAIERLALAHRRHIKVAGRTVRAEGTANLDWSDESNIVLVDRLAASGTSPSATFRRGELRQRVSRALQTLGEADREVLVLRYLEDLPFADIADALGITQNAAKVRHFRALERMRKLMYGELLG
jgi:RNA polymerase sigma-70 factor (ECF subfamily)